MEIEVNQELLDEVNIIVNTKLVKFLNDTGCSFQAMAFVLQSVIDKIDEAQEKLDKE